jgi:hypothetical protein
MRKTLQMYCLTNEIPAHRRLETNCKTKEIIENIYCNWFFLCYLVCLMTPQPTFQDMLKYRVRFEDSLAESLTQQLLRTFKLNGKLGEDLNRISACRAVNNTIRLIHKYSRTLSPYDPNELIEKAENEAWKRFSE